MDDSRSAASEQSASLNKMECPHCNKDFQVRSLFKHIKLNHFTDFMESINESKCKLNSNPEEPLELTWYKKNDFDEEEGITVYACLSSYKTFISTIRADAHFKKDKAAFTAHKKEMKKLFSDVDKLKKKRAHDLANNPLILAFKKAIAEKNPVVPRAYWRNILWFSSAAQKILDKALSMIQYPEHHTMYLAYETFNSRKDTLQMWVDDYNEKKAKMNALLAEKCLDAQALEPLLNYFERYVIVLLRHLMDYSDSFIPYYSFQSPCCLRINPCSYEDEFFWHAKSDMPGVDF
jgi:hypothetical protein